MFLSLYNNGANDDHLMSVHAPGWAASVQLSGGTVAIPGYSLVDLSGPEPSVVLSNLTKPLGGGEAVPVTLDFEHAGTVTLEVPVEPDSFYYSTYSPPPSPCGHGRRPTAEEGRRKAEGYVGPGCEYHAYAVTRGSRPKA